MWDFSWIERRWPGAGYEDWPLILDELRERGYDAIRLDAFPHLIATDAEKEWTLIPVWSVQDWGSPAKNKIKRIRPLLHEFIALCKERDIKIGLSSWYREDADNTRMNITSAKVMAEQWINVIGGIKNAGLLDAILYVDLCNEWPGDLWAPYFKNDPPELTWGGWFTETSMRWMREACEMVAKEHPELPVGFSFEPKDPSKLAGKDLSFADFADPHLWVAQANDGEFARKAGYKYDRFKLDSYQSFVEKAEPLYRAKPEYWQNLLRQHVLKAAAGFKPHKLPLITTECWGVVDFKDWPLLNWDWVKDLCRIGVETSAATGQWVAIASSNFCGPQFKGMWRDVEWHHSITKLIKSSPILPELRETKLARRI
jgi:sugar phosphate isomerase/epimerase